MKRIIVIPISDHTGRRYVQEVMLPREPDEEELDEEEEEDNEDVDIEIEEE